jgi:hypothetical protein
MADFVPRGECVKNLFCDVERREVLLMSDKEREGGSRVLRKARLRRRNQIRGLVCLLMGKSSLKALRTILGNERARSELGCECQRIAAQRRIKPHG